MGLQQRYEHTPTETRHAPPPEIGGRTWCVSGSVAKCAVPPHARPPHEEQAVTPHPTKAGWKVAWVFLGTLVALFAASPWIAKALGWCAVLALPFWMWR